MENLVLSKKAQKKALSSKKGNRETVKNVLATPYSNHFPLLKPEDAELISEALRALPKLKVANTSVPWVEIKDVPQVERKKARAKYATEVLPDVDPVIRLIFGVNEVTKLLENNCAAAVLVADDVKPLFMVKHVIDLCVYHNTPVVVMPGLRNLLKTVVGITTLTLAVKRPVVEGNCLFRIVKCVEEISLKYAVPENHVHYNRLSFNEEEVEEGDLDVTLKSLELDERKVCKDLYLYRDSKVNGRVFVPELSKDLGMDVDVEGFIGFGAIDSGNKNVPKKTLMVYRGLQVKRVRNNKDRKKKLKMKL